jgi:hypothetical protein
VTIKNRQYSQAVGREDDRRRGGEQVGATLQLQSEPGRGTDLKLTVPLAGSWTP